MASPAGKVALVQAALVRRVGRRVQPAPEVIWACKTLCKTPSVRVADLAAEVGWSRSRLASRFWAQVGLSPKRFSGMWTIVVNVDRGGGVRFVPWGVWHRVEVDRPARLVHLTPGPSGEHRPLATRSTRKEP